MTCKKVKMRKIKDPLNLAPGDLIFHKQRKCEITIIRINYTYSRFEVIFHDFEYVGGLPFSVIEDYCYLIC